MQSPFLAYCFLAIVDVWCSCGMRVLLLKRFVLPSPHYCKVSSSQPAIRIEGRTYAVRYVLSIPQVRTLPLNRYGHPCLRHLRTPLTSHRATQQTHYYFYKIYITFIFFIITMTTSSFRRLRIHRRTSDTFDSQYCHQKDPSVTFIILIPR